MPQSGNPKHRLRSNEKDWLNRDAHTSTAWPCGENVGIVTGSGYDYPDEMARLHYCLFRRHALHGNIERSRQAIRAASGTPGCPLFPGSAPGAAGLPGGRARPRQRQPARGGHQETAAPRKAQTAGLAAESTGVRGGRNRDTLLNSRPARRYKERTPRHDAGFRLLRRSWGCACHAGVTCAACSPFGPL